MDTEKSILEVQLREYLGQQGKRFTVKLSIADSVEIRQFDCKYEVIDLAEQGCGFLITVKADKKPITFDLSKFGARQLMRNHQVECPLGFGKMLIKSCKLSA